MSFAVVNQHYDWAMLYIIMCEGFFRFELFKIKQLLTKYQFLTKMPRISNRPTIKNGILKVGPYIIITLLDPLLLPYTYYGIAHLPYHFGSVSPLNCKSCRDNGSHNSFTFGSYLVFPRRTVYWVCRRRIYHSCKRHMKLITKLW